MRTVIIIGIDKSQIITYITKKMKTPEKEIFYTKYEISKKKNASRRQTQGQFWGEAMYVS